jgi:hypothetical protein
MDAEKDRSRVESKNTYNKIKAAVAMINKLRREQEVSALAKKSVSPPCMLVRRQLYNYLNEAIKKDVALINTNQLMPKDIHACYKEQIFGDEDPGPWAKNDLRKLAH